MAAVAISKETAGKYLRSSVVVACENAPESITLSGDADNLHVVLDSIKADFPDVRSRVLNVPIAYHSRKSPLYFTELALTGGIQISSRKPGSRMKSFLPPRSLQGQHPLQSSNQHQRPKKSPTLTILARLSGVIT